jgi:hypothetical protein
MRNKLRPLVNKMLPWAPMLGAIIIPLEVLGILVFAHLGHPVIAACFGFALMCDMIGWAVLIHQAELRSSRDKEQEQDASEPNQDE